MAEITAAVDEGGANTLFNTALSLLPLPPQSGSGSLGPFVASYSASASFVHGSVDLIAPGTVRVANLRLNWHVSLSFGIDLNSFLPSFCLPQVCVDIPCVGRVCTPRVCISWPTITVPVSLGDFVEATADFGLDIALVGGQWRVRAVVQNVSQLQFGPATAGMLVLIGLAITPLLLAIPFIGPFVAIAVNAILAAIGVAGLLGLLGPIISPFVSGLVIPIYNQPQHFQVLPAAGPNDPAVFVTLDNVTAVIQSSDEDELVLGVDISA
ncbi:MAG: hypothetical protein GXC94_18345 [Comamonadaceae bacterium]|jgi:hypothetical protein|nr:hypothetical protein [Comamonadaceae bacterium]